jgi:hypothetical protein
VKDFLFDVQNWKPLDGRGHGSLAAGPEKLIHPSAIAA